MSIHVRVTGALEQGVDGLVLALFQGEKPDMPHLQAIDQAIGGLLRHVLELGDFAGKSGERLILHALSASPRRVAVVGLGKREDISLETVRCAIGHGVRGLRDGGAKVIGLFAVVDVFGDAELAQAVTEGAMLSLYQMNDYRTRDRDEIVSVNELQLWVPGGVDTTEAQRGADVGRKLAGAMKIAQDLTVHPSNVATPAYMAEAALRAGQETGLKVRVYDLVELEAMGFRTLLAVNRASADTEPAKFIVMEWKGAKTQEAPIVIVGKAVTFDTGGISIKPSAGMELMKFDMAGGAATIAIMRAVADLGLERNVIGLVPATENMVSGAALKPGDVITTYAGLTVEVNNTDAEGRLILADALAYAANDLKAQAIIDMATLTGACLIALGNETIAVIGNQGELAQRLVVAGERSGERGWQLPLWDAYGELIKSDIADMKNSGGREAGTISAAYFLSKFVGDTPWCHLDVAGAAWAERDKPYLPKGPTGAPVRMVIEALRNWAPTPTV